MKKSIFSVVLILLTTNALNAQFIYKNRIKANQLSTLTKDDNNKLKEYNNTFFVIAGGNGEGLATAELLHGFLGKGGKAGRLAFGGTIAKAEQSSTGDLKAILQGGGNFFLSHSLDFGGTKDVTNRGFYMFLLRTKLGTIIPSLGTSTNVIQAHIDPGVEFQFNLNALNNDDDIAIGLVGAIRGGFLWLTNPYAVNMQLNRNAFPYLYITGGVKLKDAVQIVYSQQFFSNDILSSGKPSASIGLSVVL